MLLSGVVLKQPRMILKPRYVQEHRDFRSRYAAAIVNKVDGVVCLFCVWIYVNGKSQVLFYTKSKVGILLKQLNFIFN